MSNHPAASSLAVRRRMQAVRRRDTDPEVAIRRELHRRGLRYRVDQTVLPSRRRRADIVFRAARVVVFVDGCFWHSCPKHATRPKSNRAWWTAKLVENERRDRRTDRALAAAGWMVIRIWEHERPTVAARRISRMVRTRL
jgi:DNA mismatch endonuclease (patch repair protein)